MNVPACIVRIAGLALAGGMMAVLVGCSEEAVKAEAIIRPVKTMTIAAVDPASRAVYSGSVKARTEMALGFRVSGKMIERKVDIGQRVKPGDTLARLDATDLQLAVRRAEADLASIRTQVDTVEVSYQRALKLFDQKAISKSELEQRKLNYDQAMSSLKSAASTLEQARNQVAYTDLKTDQNGIVTAVSADVGQVVGAGTPVMTVAVDGEKEVQIAVPEMDISHFAVGQSVKARFWSNADIRLEGKVREVAGSADSQSRTFTVRIRVNDDPRVLLGMTATIEAAIPNEDQAITVPLSSLAEQGGQPIVWLVNTDATSVYPQNITLAGYSDNGVRVSKGLKIGDTVVIAGTQFLQDNLKVRLLPDDTAAMKNARPSAFASVQIAGN